MTNLVESVSSFFWMAVEASGLLVYLWPVSIAVLGLFLTALLAGAPLRDPRFRRSLRLLSITYLVPLAVLLAGTLLRYEAHGPPHPDWQRPPEWFFYVLLAPVILHLLVLVGGFVAAKGFRLRALGVLLPGVWLSLCAYFIAASYVNGVGP